MSESEPATGAATGVLDGAGFYEIRIKGHLDRRWAHWFEGLIVTLEANGETLIRGLVVDQAALHGVLRNVRDLGMPLIAVVQVDPNAANNRCRSSKGVEDERQSL